MSTRRAKPAADDAVELELEPSPVEALAQFFGAPGDDDVEVSIFELGLKGERSYLFAFPLSQAPRPSDLMSDLLGKWGAGHYEAFAQRTDGTIAFRKNFRVGSERDRRRAAVPERPGAEAAPAAAAPTRSDEISPALRAILEQQNRLIEALANREQPRERDTLEIARELAQLKELFAPPAPTGNLLETLKDFMAIKEQLSDGEKNPFTVAVERLAPTFERALDHVTTRGRPSPGAAAPNGDGGGPMQAWLHELRQMAEAETAPAAAATRVLEVLATQAEWIEQMVLGLIVHEGDAAVDRVITLEPALAGSKSWLIAVVRELYQQLEAGEREPAASDQGQHAANGSPQPA